MLSSRRVFMSLGLTVVTLSAACKGAEQVCDPADPLCGSGGGGSTVASIEVTSPIDSVMAVGRTAQLSAVARDANQNQLTVTFDWSSTNEAAATVSSGGLVTGNATGATSIRADAGNRTGTYPMRVVAADLTGIGATLTDPFALALVAGLDAATASTVNGLVSTCAGHIQTGFVLALDQCLIDLMNVTGVGGNDAALLAVLDLFLDHAQRQLQL